MEFKNVVLVVADTLRAKNLPSYGSEEVTTNFLNQQKSVDNYYSNSPWTLPAHATLFTGELPSEHGVTTKNPHFFNQTNKLVRYFGNKGYNTYSLSENVLISEELGFGPEFDVMYNPQTDYIGAKSWNYVWQEDGNFGNRFEKYGTFIEQLISNRDINSIYAMLDHLKFSSNENVYNSQESFRTVENALRILSNGDRNFLFMNMMATHTPYTFSEKEKEKFLPELSKDEIEYATKHMYKDYNSKDEVKEILSDRKKCYKASIAYLDRLLEDLYKRSPKDTLFIVVGDHGELTGEYEKEGELLTNHHFGTFKELIEVPLFIYSKGDYSLSVLEDDRLYDHRSLHSYLKSMLEGKENLPNRDIVQAEYFGDWGVSEYTDMTFPKERNDITSRKSFSLVNNEFKFDVATDGDYLWERKPKTEKDRIDLNKIPGELSQKSDILYRWRLEE